MSLLVCYILLLWRICSAGISNVYDCQNNHSSFMKNDAGTLFVIRLSKEQVTYKEAEKQCNLLGGKVANIKEREKQHLQTYLNRLLLKDPTLVNVTIKTARLKHIDDLYDSYLYTLDSSKVKTKSNTMKTFFHTPARGELQRVMLYTKNKIDSKFNKSIKFCRYGDRDTIRTTQEGGWKTIFELKTAKEESNSAIKLFNYLPPSDLSSKLSLNPITSNDFSLSLSLPYIYLPDISVFTGARFDVGRWHWNNNKTVKEKAYLPLNQSACQVMTWPLTYEDGINMLSKPCDTGMAHYICLAAVDVKLEAECGGRSLRLSIPLLISNVADITYNIQKDTETNVDSSFTFNRSLSSISIGNLMPDSNYVVQVAFFVPRSCKNDVGFPAVSRSKKTGYDNPNPVTTAFVLNSTSSTTSCLISWKHNVRAEENITYKIIAYTSNTTKTSRIVYPNSIIYENEMMIRQVDLGDLGYNKIASFQIQAVSECGLESEITHVNGTCTTPPQSFLMIYISAIAGSVAAIGLVVYIMCFICLRKTTFKKPNNLDALPKSTSRKEAVNEWPQNALTRPQCDLPTPPDSDEEYLVPTSVKPEQK